MCALARNDRILLECPVAVTEHRNNTAVFAHCIDVHAVAADHEVLVDHGIVDAQLTALLQRLVLEVLDGIGKAHAQSQMAGSVFIEQGVVEQNAALADRAVLGNRSTLAQLCCAFIHGNHGVQQVFTHFCLCFHDNAALKRSQNMSIS